MATATSKEVLNINCALAEKSRLADYEKRRLYLYGTINDYDTDTDSRMFNGYASMVGEIVEAIFVFNREDKTKPPKRRDPIKLYINSPGGDLNEGFALIDAIKLSKTPVHTINVGQWSSMSFLIGITGHKRFSLPSATFLMHDGSSGAFGSTNKVQDLVEFERRFKDEVIKKHVLAHSKMKSADYDALARVEYYLLPTDALESGFIDKIVTDIDEIL